MPNGGPIFVPHEFVAENSWWLCLHAASGLYGCGRELLPAEDLGCTNCFQFVIYLLRSGAGELITKIDVQLSMVLCSFTASHYCKYDNPLSTSSCARASVSGRVTSHNFCQVWPNLQEGQSTTNLPFTAVNAVLRLQLDVQIQFFFSKSVTSFLCVFSTAVAHRK